MHLFPEDILQTLEFTRIRELTAEMCMGDPGRNIARNITPATDAKVIRRRIEETDEWNRMLEGPNALPFSPYQDIREAIKFLEIIDYILDAEDLLHIRILIHSHLDWHKWLSDELVKVYPVLTTLIGQLPYEEKPKIVLDRVFDEKGEVKDDASPALKTIRRAIINRMKELEKSFQMLVALYRKQGWLSESGESVRNGRRVLIVPSEHKRKIKGIIHDESSTGKTVFLEPEQLVEINNDLFELESEERLEILRILKEVCQQLQPFIPYFKQLMKLATQLDVIRAKAMVSRMYKGNRASIGEDMIIRLKNAYHPLLWIKNVVLHRAVVPFDLELNPENRILVLSGPNAGGKSITMKSVLLIQILAQSGYLIPAAPGSSLPVYQKCFADIGDQQSLEDDLSTYSSKLRNMRSFLEFANKRTLIALDEFGSGTDPKIGGAIAESILHALNSRKVMGVVTTHYSNLKIYAFKQPGLVNGAMVFDQEHLRPSYALRIGKPGSSYAFEIATSSGLPEPVIRYARDLTGPSSQAVEQLLVDLQNERRILEDQLLLSKEKQRRLDHLIQSYEEMFRDLEYQRKKIKLETKELALLQKSSESVGVDEVIRKLKEVKSLERAIEMKAVLAKEQDRLRSQVRQIREEVQEKQPVSSIPGVKELAIGAFVRLRIGGAVGEVLELDKKKAQLSVGGLTMIVPLQDIEVIQEPLSIRSRSSVRLPDSSDDNIANRLDIRGFKKEEALRVIELFLDKALMTSSRSVRILHGKGNGTLRKTVIQKAKEYKDIKAIEPGAPEDGGEGVTIIRFG